MVDVLKDAELEKPALDVREGRGVVFRIDKEPSGIRDSDENTGRICLSYVFGVFPIPVLVLGYLVAYAFRDDLIVMWGRCRFVGLVVDSITTDHATRPSLRRRSMMLMPNSVLILLSRYQTM